MNHRLLIPILGLLFFAYACKESKKEEEVSVVQLPAEKLKQDLKTLEDSNNVAWAAMIQEDDQKIAYIKRLLEEISYTPKYDAVTQAKLINECNELKSKRFNQTSILDSTILIDQYDAATDHLIKGVNALAIATPNIESYPLANELIQDITNLDNNVIVRRIACDKWAMKYNQLLDEQKTSLEQLGPAYTTLKKKGLFQIEG